MVLILAGFRLAPICPCLFMDLRIYPSSPTISFHFTNKLSSSSLIGKTLPVPNWSVLEKLSFIIGLPLCADLYLQT